MWGGIGAQHEARLARGRSGAQRQPVLFAFGHRQAVVMRFDATRQDVVAVDDQVMRGDRRGKVGASGAGISDAFLSGDMFHHHAQTGDAAAQRVKDGVDEHGLAVENIHRGIGDFAVQAQGQADFGHFLQHSLNLGEILHAGMRIGGGPGGVKLQRLDQTGGGSGGHIGGVGAFGQVEGHQRFKA